MSPYTVSLDPVGRCYVVRKNGMWIGSFQSKFFANRLVKKLEARRGLVRSPR